MTSGKAIGTLAPFAAAAAFAVGMMVQQRHTSPAPQGILGAGVFVPAGATAQSGRHLVRAGGWSRPGGTTRPGKTFPGGLVRPGGKTWPGGLVRPGGRTWP